MQLIGPRDRKGDCVARAITFITSGDYTEVEDMILREQSSYGPYSATKGVYTHRFLKSSRVIQGVRFTLMANMRGKTVGLFRTLFNTGTYLVCKAGHAFVIRDGEVYDANETPDRVQLVEAWKAEKVVAV